MTRRTEIQLACLAIGLVVWGYGQRTDNSRLTWIGDGFFGAAVALRFKKRPEQEPLDNDSNQGP